VPGAGCFVTHAYLVSEARASNLGTNTTAPHNGSVDPLDTLEHFRLTSQPNKSDRFYDRELATALQKAAKHLSAEHLDEIMHLVARDRQSAIPDIFRAKDIPAAHAPLMDGLDHEEYLYWSSYFLREGLRRNCIVETSSIYNDIARYTSVPGARKRLPDIVRRHVVERPLLEAIQVSIERPGRLPQWPDGGVHYPIMCVWLAIDGSARSLESLRRYCGILAGAGGSFARHVSEIVIEYAANDATRAMAHEFARVSHD
jgi:hypothetical protein